MEEITRELEKEQNSKIFIFFDEFNTNSNISGLFKEIIIDRKINGIPINPRIIILAACNPYQVIPYT